MDYQISSFIGRLVMTNLQLKLEVVMIKYAHWYIYKYNCSLSVVVILGYKYTNHTVGSNTGNFDSRKGYQMASSGSGGQKEVEFSGTPHTW